MSFHNPGNPLPGQSLSQGVLLADYCVGQMRGQRGGGGTDAEEERQGLCGARNSRLWIRCGGMSLRDWHRLFFFPFLPLKMVSKDKSECQSKICRLSLDS